MDHSFVPLQAALEKISCQSQAVSRLPDTVEALIPSQSSPSFICVERSGNGVDLFIAQYIGFRLSNIFHKNSVLILLSATIAD
jgi:hypothetical protein